MRIRNRLIAAPTTALIVVGGITAAYAVTESRLFPNIPYRGSLSGAFYAGQFCGANEMGDDLADQAWTMEKAGYDCGAVTAKAWLTHPDYGNLTIWSTSPSYATVHYGGTRFYQSLHTATGS